MATVLSTTRGTPDLVRHRRDALDVEDVLLGVGDGLAEEGLGAGGDGLAPGVEVVRVLDEGDVDAQLRERVVEQVVGTAVQARARHDVVARLGQVEQGDGLGRLPAGHQQGGDAALEAGHPLLDGVLGRVHDSGVDVAELLQPEQGCGVVGVTEHVRGRLVDRQRPGAGGRVGCLPGVDLAGLESPIGVAHDTRSWCLGAQRPRACPRHLGEGRVITRGTPPRLEGCRPASRG